MFTGNHIYSNRFTLFHFQKCTINIRYCEKTINIFIFILQISRKFSFENLFVLKVSTWIVWDAGLNKKRFKRLDYVFIRIVSLNNFGFSIPFSKFIPP